MNVITNKAILNRKQALALVARDPSELNNHLVLAIMAEIAQFGYTLDKPLIDVMSTLTKIELKIVKELLVSELAVMVGANVRYVPLFKSFPNDIPDTTELMFKKIVGYLQNIFKINPANYVVLSCGHTVSTTAHNLDNYSGCPICEAQLPELMDHDDSYKPSEPVKQFKIIKLVDESVIFDVYKNLLTAKTSISNADKALIVTLTKHFGDDILQHLPEKIDQKETVAFVTEQLLTYTTSSKEAVAKYFKTATDVLRLAVQFSGGDISLAANTKFKLSQGKRKFIMFLLDKVYQPEVDMLRYREQWVKLGQTLHVGSFKNKFPNAFNAFDMIRNHASDIETFNGKVEELLSIATHTEKNEKEVEALVALLETRAGDFARRLDHVLRIAQKPAVVLKAFKKVAPSVQTAMLLNLAKHAQSRTQKSEFRAFAPKGKITKIKLFEGDEREVLKPMTVNALLAIINDELKSRFSKLEALGNVYINPELMKVLVPYSQRSASTSLVNIPRGSRLKVDPASPFIRLFTYWKAPVDIDLGAVLLDEKFRTLDTISYYNLSSYGRSVHSGDIRNGSHGAVEFIDLDVKAFKAKKARYVAVYITSYTGEQFSTMECFAGFMERTQPDGKQFDATTVRQKFNITSEATNCVPMLFDLETSELVWLDLVTQQAGIYANYHNSQNVTLDAIKSGLSLIDTRATMFELLDAHAKARSTVVHYEKVEGVEYDTVFDIEILKDLDVVMSKYLA